MANPNRKRTQWHPLFAELLRPLLQDYYDVQTNVPVGDAPRESDILLLLRSSAAPPPFRGLWRHLTPVNVAEFKGPTVSARLGDLSRLVEVGLGIQRRVNEERRRARQVVFEPEAVSFWYFAKSIGPRLRKEFRSRLGELEEVEAGLWRSQILGHTIYFVSSKGLRSEPDTVPLHLLVNRPEAQELELAQLVVQQPRYLEWYGPWLSTLHRSAWLEVRNMATTKQQGLQFDFSGVKDDISEKGIEKLITSLGIKRVFEAVGPEKFLREAGMEWLLSKLSPAELKKLKRILK